MVDGKKNVKIRAIANVAKKNARIMNDRLGFDAWLILFKDETLSEYELDLEFVFFSFNQQEP